MVYVTGDPHGSIARLAIFCEEHQLTAADIIVLLGDVGTNYFLDQRDKQLKAALNALGPTFLCIHGNHEARPTADLGYIQKEWNGGIVFYQPEFPDLLFAKDGEVYTLNKLRCLAIGGAYSVDKYHRIARGWKWFEDEQPSAETRQMVEWIVKEQYIDVVFSHTCPARYIPVESYIAGIDQSTVDQSTEEWLDQIEEIIDYKAWFCGHWHVDKSVDKFHFLFNEFKRLLPKEEER